MSEELTAGNGPEPRTAEGVEAEVVDVHGPPATQLSVLPTPVPDATGVPAVDAALVRLAELADLDSDAEQHVAVLEDVHDRLQAALTGPDTNSS